MAAISKSKPQIERAEDLPQVFTQPTRWNTSKDCKKSVFLSLDVGPLLRSKATLLDAMSTKVEDIMADALAKGILVKNKDGSIQFYASKVF
jgi:hypothetical protein